MNFPTINNPWITKILISIIITRKTSEPTLLKLLKKISNMSTFCKANRLYFSSVFKVINEIYAKNKLILSITS